MSERTEHYIRTGGIFVLVLVLGAVRIWGPMGDEELRGTIQGALIMAGAALFDALRVVEQKRRTPKPPKLPTD